MRALAEFIMRGRVQAALVAILPVPILPLAALALVTLRQGYWDGVWVLLWAFAPMLMAIWSNADLLFWAMANLGTLIAVYIGALLLRWQLSWATTLMALVALVFVFTLAFLAVFDAQISAFLQDLIEAQKASLTRQGIAYDESLMVLPPNWQFIGLGGYGVVLTITLALVIGRWWQAALYNPGGFRQEFSQLRLPAIAATVLMLVVVLCVVNANYRLWAWLLGFPLVMASISMAHQFAGLQRMGRAWLIIFYLALLSLPFYLLMASVGFFDAWTNFRRRLLPANADENNNEPDN